MRLSIDVDDGRAFKTLLDMGVRADRVRPLLADLADDWQQINTDRFASEGKPRWKPLSPVTVAARGSAHPILVDSGALRDSLTRAGAKNSIRQVTADEMVAGTDLEYARFLHTGTRSKTGSGSRIPRRRFATMNKATKLRWSGWIAAFIVEGERP